MYQTSQGSSPSGYSPSDYLPSSHPLSCYSSSYGSPAFSQGRLEELAGSSLGYHSLPRHLSEGNIAYSAGAPTSPDQIAGIFRQETPLYGRQSQYRQEGAAELMADLKAEYNFLPDNFLIPGREGKFVGEAEEIRGFTEEAFEKLFGEKFPDDIKVSVLKAESFRKIAPHPATIGLSLNRREQGGLSEIFVANDSLGRVMLTLGHELGHVLTPTLDDRHDEEAKAYAFSLQWMKVIRENDIAGLAGAIITERPADNGLHNAAFFSVEKWRREGKQAWEIYLALVKRMLSVPAGAEFKL